MSVMARILKNKKYTMWKFFGSLIGFFYSWGICYVIIGILDRIGINSVSNEEEMVA